MEEECLICYDCEGEMHELECGHKFHTECIISWFRSGKTECPYCRKKPDTYKEEQQEVFNINDTPSINYKKLINEYLKKNPNERKKLIEYKKENALIKKEMSKKKKEINKEIEELLEKKLQELPENYKKNITKITTFCNKCVNKINDEYKLSENNDCPISKWCLGIVIRRKMGMRRYRRRIITVKSKYSILINQN
jgi:Fe2+ transport system protein B